MSFPNPKTPDEWQTAYTRDQAYTDSGKYAMSLILPVLLCLLFALSYSLFWAARYYLATPPTILRGAIALLLVIAVIIIFPIMLLAAFRTAGAFLSAFYRPPVSIEPVEIIQYRLFGKSKLPPPLNMLSQFKYVMINDGDILKKDSWPAWAARHIGGPIMLIVFDGYAAYLERGNRFSRVVGPGEKTPFLEWFETIKYVVDLRPQVKIGETDGWTKDGIKIKIQAKIECRIGDPANPPPGEGLIYPFDPVAVKKAIERYSLRWPKRLEGNPEEFTWIDATWGQVTGIIPGYIASRMLDDLFIAERESGQILSPDAMKELLAKLNSATNGFGVFVTDFQILKIEFPQEVYNHQKENWKAEKQSIATIRGGETNAFKIRAREKERADAQRHLIRTIVSGLDKSEDGKFTEPLLLSLPGLLDEGLKDPYVRAYLTNKKLEDTLEQLEKITKKTDKKKYGDDMDYHEVGEEDDEG
jgi:regulator of protease activity HflC (stomatin/prohibitin superfamily)